MISNRSWAYIFCLILSSSIEVESVIDLRKKQNYTKLEYDPLSVLGIEDTTKLRSSWVLTVNDQCLYEFVYQFEHPESFPIGDEEFEGKCDFGTLDDPLPPKIAPDGIPYLKSRRYWERFPDYVWATMGFNHFSVDWLPCGRKPAGYKQPQYDFSFFRVTPEYRAQTMVCKLSDNPFVTTVPFEEYCDTDNTQQGDINGMNFFVVPGTMFNMDPVVNMPFEFTQRHEILGAIPHEGLRAWDESRVPDKPNDWNHLHVFMSTYAGNLAMWQTHVPYKFINGEKRQFHSLAHRYFETTIQTLPDTWAVKYDETDGKIYLTLVGKAEICRGDFERVQKAAGGPPVFPNYTALDEDNSGLGESENSDDGSGESSGASFTSIGIASFVQIAMIAFALKQ